MIDGKIVRHTIVYLAIFMLSSATQAGVMKCVDKKGNITFSDSGCASGKMGQHVYISPTTESPNKRYEYSSDDQDVDYGYDTSFNNSTSTNRQAANVNSGQQAQARRYEDRQRLENDLRIANASRNNNGRPLTRKERGLPSSFYSAPMPPSPPPNITSCDGAGCWDNRGTRYNKGAGSTYFPSSGGSCQNIGGQMQCN